MSEPSTKKRVGRPRKEIPIGYSTLTVELPTADKEYIERMATILGKPPGRLIRHAIETHVDLVPLLARQHRDMQKMQEMFAEMKATIRTVATFKAAALREMDGDDAESFSGFEPDFSFDDK